MTYTSIQQFRMFLENNGKLVPRNLDNRFEKLRQKNLKMLQLETVTGNIAIDNFDVWNFSSNEVKVKILKGSICLTDQSKIPE